MHYRILAFSLAFLFIGAVKAGAVEISASVNKRVVSVGDKVVLSVKVSGAPRGSNPTLPPLDGFRLAGTSQSTQIQFVNGAGSISTQYDYSLMALTAGRHTIGAVSLSIGGKVYKTGPLTVEVAQTPQAAAQRAAEDQPKYAPPAASTGKSMFIELGADKPEAFLHEQVILTFRFYCAAGLAEQPVYEPPAAPGCVAKVLGEGHSKNYMQVVNGRRYQVSEIKTALFPYQTGELTIGPAKISGSVIVEPRQRRRNSRNVFDMDDFFGNPFGGFFSSKPFQLVSNQVKILVKPLPAEGAPAGEVSVGEYRLRVDAKPREIHAGDPITLTMTVSGEGDLDAVAAPVLSNTEGFKTYEPTGSTDITAGADLIRGDKRFEQAIVPLNDNIKQIPEVLFYAFDPKTAKYATLKSGPIPIKVLPQREGGAAKIVSGPSGAEKKGVQLLERNIVFIKSSPGILIKRGEGRGSAILFRALQAIPALLIVLAFVHARHRTRLARDMRYARLHRTGKMTRGRLKSAEEALRRGDVEGLYCSLARALNMYIADRLDIPAGGLTTDMIVQKLAAQGLDAELLRRIEDFARACELARFASVSTGRPQMEKALGEATAILEALRKKKFTQGGR